MTGAISLWHKLTSLNVVKSIKLGEEFIVFKSFPRFLSDFHSLEELSIHSYNHQWSRNLGMRIDLIPSGVRKLELTGKWKQCGDKLFGDHSAPLKLNECLPHLEIVDFCCLKFSNYSWMIYFPQSLTKLTLKRWDGQVELPTSLIRFKADQVDISKRTFVSKLPPTLESFVAISEVYGVDLVVPLLPPSSRKVYLGGLVTKCSAGPSIPNILELLPKSLTWLAVPRCAGINFVENPELTELLPSTLRKLQIVPDFPFSAWRLLPQQLTELSFQSPSTKVEFCNMEEAIQSSLPFGMLPRAITSLRVLVGSFQEQYWSGSDASCFPPQLTYLKISNVQLSPQTAKLLPSSLTFLHLGNFCERVCKHLPDGLKTLISHATLMSPNLSKFLPRSLTHLQLAAASASNTWFDYDTGEKIESVAKLQWEYSMHTKCLSPSFAWKHSSPLPPKLAYFILKSAHNLGDSFLLHTNLPNLFELNLSSSCYFTDLSIPVLSPNLTSLNLRSASRITGRSFEFLPRSLTFFDLSSSESIFDPAIQCLPRSLKRLFLSRAVYLTDMCIPDLPPNLEKLSLNHNSQITPASFSCFPLTLRSSQTLATCTVELSNWFVFEGKIGP